MMELVSHDQLQQVVEALGVPMIELDESLIIRGMNKAALEWDARQPSEVIGKSFFEAWPSMVDSDVGRVLPAVLESGESQTVEIHYQGFSGIEKWTETRVQSWGTGVILISSDISKQKLAEVALKEASDRFRMATMASGDFIYDWDMPVDLIRWSEPMMSMFGLDMKSSVTDVSWWEERIHIEDREKALSSLQHALITSGTSYWVEEYRLRQDSGDYRSVLDRAFIVRNEKDEPVRMIGAMIDLTAQREAEQEVKHLQSELIHISRVSAMGTMASTLAHELNQPLTAITNYLAGCERILEQKPFDRKGLEKALENARESADRAGEIIRRIRLMVTKGEVNKEPVKVDVIMNDALALGLMGVRKSDVAVISKIDASLCVFADSVQLQQVLLNLIRNAIEAMENSETRELKIKARESGDNVVIEISDTGAGIPPEDRDRLFDPFFSTKKSGLGIGLLISRTIVEAHSGHIWTEASEGGGANFVIELPACRRPLVSA